MKMPPLRESASSLLTIQFPDKVHLWGGLTGDTQSCTPLYFAATDWHALMYFAALGRAPDYAAAYSFPS